MIELLLFTAFFAITGGIVVALLLATNENRVRQQTIASVELAGLQMIQTLEQTIRTAERVLDPPAGEQGSVLTLQVADSASDPTILSVQTGSLVLIRRDTRYDLSPPEVTVSDLLVDNTSVSADRNSVRLTLTIQRSVPLVPAFTYSRNFLLSVTVLPDDDLQGDACSCDAPTCTLGVYDWEICDDDECEDPTTMLGCEE